MRPRGQQGRNWGSFLDYGSRAPSPVDLLSAVLVTRGLKMLSGKFQE